MTGGASGIGAAVALALGAAGAFVAVNYRSRPEQAEDVVRQIAAAGGKAMSFGADVSQEAEVVRMFDAIGSVGRLDIVVANSGIQQDAAFTEMSLQQWQRVIERCAC